MVIIEPQIYIGLIQTSDFVSRYRFKEKIHVPFPVATAILLNSSSQMTKYNAIKIWWLWHYVQLQNSY